MGNDVLSLHSLVALQQPLQLTNHRFVQMLQCRLNNKRRFKFERRDHYIFGLSEQSWELYNGGYQD